MSKFILYSVAIIFIRFEFVSNAKHESDFKYTFAIHSDYILPLWE